MQTNSANDAITERLPEEFLSAVKLGTQERQTRRRTTGVLRRSFVVLVLLTLSLTALADWLFYLQPLGWTAGAYIVVLTPAVLFRLRKSVRYRPGVIITLALLGLVVALVCQPGPLVLSLGALGIVSLAMIERTGWSPNASVWFRRWLLFVVIGWFSVFRDTYLYRKWQKAGHGTSVTSVLGKSVRNWLLPAFLGSIFVCLFILANPILDQWSSLLQQFVLRLLESLQLEPVRILFWSFVGCWIWGLLRISRHQESRSAKMRAESSGQSGAAITPALIARCLTLFNGIFAVQTTMDLAYLYGEASLPAGMTYASYAHRGAYPLIAAALLAGIFVLVTFRPSVPTREMRRTRRLVYMWLAQNIFLTLSALWRLHLYVQVYSLTRWRVAAALWMLLIAAGLFWIAIRIVAGQSNRWLLNINFFTTLLVLYSGCFVNFDGLISWYNVRHCREVTGQGVPIDLAYLHQLGPESLPALRWLSNRMPSSAVGAKAQRHATELQMRLQQLLQNWRAWTYRRSQLTKTP